MRRLDDVEISFVSLFCALLAFLLRFLAVRNDSDRPSSSVCQAAREFLERIAPAEEASSGSPFVPSESARARDAENPRAVRRESAYGHEQSVRPENQDDVFRAARIGRRTRAPRRGRRGSMFVQRRARRATRKHAAACSASFYEMKRPRRAAAQLLSSRCSSMHKTGR